MNKRLLSTFMALLMVCSLVMYLPANSVVSIIANAATSTNWVWPTYNHSIQNDWPNYSSGNYHGGTDFPVSLNTPVYSSCDGEVVGTITKTDQYGNYISYGKYVKIRATVNDATVYMYYCHLNGFNVSKGDHVRAGQQIAISGSTGKSTGPHLHYEVRNANDTWQPNLNPRLYLPGSSYSYSTWDDTCNCSTSYAGTYEVTTSQYPLTIRSGHGISYEDIGKIPKGAHCTVTKADGSWAHVEYNGVSGFASMEYLRKINTDTTKPTISNVNVTDVSVNGYTVTCNVSDNVGISRVQFPTWTVENGQDDIFSGWDTNSKASGTISGNTVTYRVNRSDHNNEFGTYRTHIYAYDTSGNWTCVAINDVNVGVGQEMTSGAGQTIPDGDYIIVSELGRRMYLDIPEVAYPAPEGIDVTICNASTLPGKNDLFDTWTVKYLDNGYYKINQNNTNVTLDVKNASLAVGNEIMTHYWHGGTNQQWSISETSHGYRIQSRSTGWYLDVRDAGTATGTKVQMCQAIAGDKAQAWGFIPIATDDRPVADGTYKIKSECGDVYLDAYGHANTGDYVNGTNIDIALSKNDSFNIAYVDDGFYTLREASTGLAVEVEDEDKTTFLNKDKNIQLGTFTGERRQLWKIVDEGNGKIRFVSKLSGYSLDLAGMKTENGSNVQQHHYNTSNAQKWTLECAHNFGEWTTTTEATCTTDGEQTRKCSSCGKTENQSIPAIGHKYVDTVVEPTCTEKGYTKHVCSNCGDSYTDSETAAKGHDHNKVETIPPTETTAGYDKHTCTVCGDYFIDNIVPPISSVEIPTVSYIPGDSSVRLTWTAVKNAEKYAVCGFINNRWQKLADGNGTSYTLKNLKAGTNYKVAVIAMVGGKWKQDFSNAIIVTPNKAESGYPKVNSEVSGDQFRLKWTPVANAEKYGIAVYQNNKWKVQVQVNGNVTTFTSPKVKKGTYTMVVCAKVNGKWDTSSINSRAFKVTIQ